jgi:hypothetical protein
MATPSLTWRIGLGTRLTRRATVSTGTYEIEHGSLIVRFLTPRPFLTSRCFLARFASVVAAQRFCEVHWSKASAITSRLPVILSEPAPLTGWSAIF